MTVEESGNATFSCSLSNSSFDILWLFNGYDAGFTPYKERGVTILSINSTSSQLNIVGHDINNNSQVQCVALYIDKCSFELLDYEESEVVFLVVLGKLLQVRMS